jgi:predicted RND superfamily exporter protein
MNHSMAVCGLVLVGVGVLLILLGAWMSLNDWKRERALKIGAKKEGLDATITGLTKLLEALKGYPTGQRMIVFGILLVIIGGLFGGVSGL